MINIKQAHIWTGILLSKGLSTWKDKGIDKTSIIFPALNKLMNQNSPKIINSPK